MWWRDMYFTVSRHRAKFGINYQSVKYDLGLSRPPKPIRATTFQRPPSDALHQKPKAQPHHHPPAAPVTTDLPLPSSLDLAASPFPRADVLSEEEGDPPGQFLLSVRKAATWVRWSITFLACILEGQLHMWSVRGKCNVSASIQSLDIIFTLHHQLN